MTLSHSDKKGFATKATLVALASLTLTAPIAAFAQAEPIVITSPMVVPEPNSPISANRTLAHKMFRSLTGVSLPIDDARLKSMETLIGAKKLREASKVATSDPLFYQNKVRDMAAKMTNRDESLRAPLNDFIATFVGVVRDSESTSAKELLTGNFTYQADPNVIAAGGGAAVRMDDQADFIESNNHYNDIRTNNYSLKSILKRVNGQRAMVDNMPGALPDAAGLITTRGFMQAHADAGTNRRLVEYSFRQFMCAPITDFADGTMPDDRVGRDVDRMPGGSANKYLTTCKNCHTVMDPLRGAFARVDWVGNNRLNYTPTAVSGKMNRNRDQYPAGFATVDDSFVNYAINGKNRDAFGWRNSLSGNGMAAFGSMLANSQGFSRCMVKRVFESVCKRMPAEAETSVVRQIADDFEKDNYHMRNLFEVISLRPECGIN